MLREQLSDYICAIERIEQQCYSANTESRNCTPQGMSSMKLNLPQRQFFVLCRYCKGNHWSDQCLEFPTAEDRKEKLKDSCFLCLKQGHIAWKCLSNKRCCYCGRTNHHHRSLCPKTYKYTVNASSQLDDMETQQIRKDYQTTTTQQESENEASRNQGQVLQLDRTDHLDHDKQQTSEESKNITALEKQLDQVKSELSESRVTMLEMTNQISKLESKQKSRQEQKTKITEKVNKGKILEHIKNAFKTTEESNNYFNSETSDQKFKYNEQEADMIPHEQSQRDKLEFIDDFRKEIAELQLQNTQLKDRVLCLTGELLRSQKENQDLETQLTDCSKSLVSKLQMNEEGFQSSNKSSAGNDLVVKTFTSVAGPDNEDITILKGEQEIMTTDLNTKSLDKTKWLEVYNKEALFDNDIIISTKEQLFSLLERDKSQNVEIQTAEYIPWLWECRGDPTMSFSV